MCILIRKHVQIIDEALFTIEKKSGEKTFIHSTEYYGVIKINELGLNVLT